MAFTFGATEAIAESEAIANIISLPHGTYFHLPWGSILELALLGVGLFSVIRTDQETLTI